MIIIEVDPGTDTMMKEASQGVLEDRTMEEVLKTHLKIVKEVQSNTVNLEGMMVKETKDNFHKSEEMTID